MANQSILAAFERMWQHIVVKFVDYETKTDASTKLDEAKAYADSAASTVKNDLLNGAGTAYDTLKELGDLIDENVDALAALEQVAMGKADANHEHSWDELTDKPFGAYPAGTYIINESTEYRAHNPTPINHILPERAIMQVGDQTCEVTLNYISTVPYYEYECELGSIKWLVPSQNWNIQLTEGTILPTTVALYTIDEEVVKIDEKYVPDTTTVTIKTWTSTDIV